jgi:phosphatidylserine/phosphatidylglycerophosphate/cardiolipin synthase-like enzyme
MDEVQQQWAENGQAEWKIDVFRSVASAPNVAGKRSTPYTPTSVHDYMHAKIFVVDDTVFTGSYNFSHSGEENAENLLRIDSPALAEGCVSYIQGLVTRYGTGAAVS